MMGMMVMASGFRDLGSENCVQEQGDRRRVRSSGHTRYEVTKSRLESFAARISVHVVSGVGGVAG